MTTLDLTALRQRFGGALLTSSDGAPYDGARAVFNGMFDRRPAVIARVSSSADIVVALAFARARGMPVAVRGGGHSIAGFSSIEGGMLIDLAGLREIHVDPVARRVRVGAGASWGELDAATQASGLATTGGRVKSTGVAGFTLGSGSGWLEDGQ